MSGFKDFCMKIWDNIIGKIAVTMICLYFLFNIFCAIIGIIDCYKVANRYRHIKNTLISEGYNCEKKGDTICTKSIDSVSIKILFNDSTSSNIFLDGIKKKQNFTVTYNETHWYGTIKFATTAYSNNIADSREILIERKDGYAVFMPEKCNRRADECFLNINDKVNAPYTEEYNAYNEDVNSALRSFEKVFDKAKIKLK